MHLFRVIAAVLYWTWLDMTRDSTEIATSSNPTEPGKMYPKVRERRLVL